MPALRGSVDLTLDEVRRVARLARLDLDDAEAARFQRDVQAVLTMFEALEDSALDPPPRVAAVLRADEPLPSPEAAPLLSNVPQRDEAGRIRVVRPG